MDWIELALAMGLFMVSHRLPAALGVKGRLLATLGPRLYIGLFSALSLGLLAWVIVAAGRAPHLPLWDPMGWHRWAVNIAMPLAVILAALGTAAPNPFAFEGRATGFDPARPGIAGLTRQPLLWALALWSGSHLLANGDLAHVLVFAPFLALSLLGMPVVEARRRRAMGAAAWERASARTGLLPCAALLTGRWRPAPGLTPALGLRLALGLTLWAALWHLHAPLIGLSPAP